MRYAPINPELFKLNRERLRNLMLKNSLAVVNANDVMPSNADGTLGFRQNSDLFYLTGVDQEETILLLFPNASDEKMREVLFVRETSPLIATWEALNTSHMTGFRKSRIDRRRGALDVAGTL